MPVTKFIHPAAVLGWASLLGFLVPLLADGPADNRSDKVRRVPPPGLAVPEDVRRELTGGVAKLGADLEAAQGTLTEKDTARRALLPDRPLKWPR